MLTPTQIKEDINHSLPLFSPGEEDLLFDTIRHEARHGLNFVVGQSSDCLQKLFKAEELSCEAKALVRELHLFTAHLVED